MLPLKLPGTFTYSVPADMEVAAGCRVQVPVGESKTYQGIVMRTHSNQPSGDFTVKPITSADPRPVATPLMLRLWQWMADYYLCPLGDVMRAAIPAKMKTVVRRKTPVAIAWDEPQTLPTLTAAQQAALDTILADSHPTTLLHGVTASGKTAVYEHLISRATGQVLYLVPEIALTTQLEDRLRALFGNRIGVFHSKMTEAARAEVWERQLSANPYPVILGARSSVFLPFRNLSLVIIDEEHEMSYKQQEPSPRYHARNVALMLARYANARVVLGSATPSMESFYHTRMGHYGLAQMKEKFLGCAEGADYRPQTTDYRPSLTEGGSTNFVVADTAELRRKKLMKGIVSPVLREAMEAALGRGEQVILFQNRRGWASQVECKECGWTPRCLRCDVSLTMHRRMGLMVCHTCGATYGMPAQCPQCECADMRPHGIGTEKVEDEVRRLFPDARVSRLDLDSAKTRDDFADIVTDFAQGHSDILIGTQMVTKGLDFERVSVVGVLAADTALNAPDFRAYERAYELMAQVAGRAGRKGMPATVVIQTRQPDLPVVRHVVEGNYLAHYKEVMRERMDFCYPPFCRLVDIYFKHRYENVAQDVAQSFVRRITEAQMAGVEVLGPDAPAKARVSNLYIQKAVVKIRPEADLTTVKSFLLSLFWEYLHSTVWRQPLVLFDVDPNN